MQEHARERTIDVHIEAKLLPFCKQPLRDVLMIMRDSGMRNQKEVFTMRWEHVDWPNNRYFVYDSSRVASSSSTIRILCTVQENIKAEENSIEPW
jgi:integrase